MDFNFPQRELGWAATHLSADFMSHETKPLLPAGGNLPMARFFRDVPDNVRHALLETVPAIHLKKDQRLFERGDAGGTLYVVQAGRIEISIVTEDGRKVLLNLVGPNHCFGEVSMIDNLPRTASAVALDDTTLQAISRSKFLEAVNQCPALGVNLMVILCERIRWASDSVEEYALLSLQRRLVRRLIMLHEKFAEPDGSIDIAQSELADFAGATREATNKILMQMKAAGLISLTRRKIQLNEIHKLNRIAYGEEA